MKKNIPYAHIIFAVAFVLFNVIAFAVPAERTTSFWITYVFSIISFVVQPFVWKVSFGKDEKMKSKFLGFPLIHLGLVYTVIQLIAFAVFMLFSHTPSWIAVIVNALIAGVFAVSLLSVDSGAKEIVRIEDKVEQNVNYIKELQIDVEMLVESETDTETKKSLEALAEKIRFSNVMSNEKLFELENKIKEKVEELKTSGDKISLSQDVGLLLEERNRKCKLLK